MTSLQWDDNKRASNLAKHNVDFEDMKTLWDDWTIEHQDTRIDYGEDRFVTLGEVNGMVFAVVYTWRGSSRRIISARKASDGERSAYYQARPG